MLTGQQIADAIARLQASIIGVFSDPTTTKGDLIVHGASTTRLPVGSNDQVLTADSAQASGVKWATLNAYGVRATASVTSSSLANNAYQQTNITIAKSFRLVHIQTDVAARVRLYSTAANQAADASRVVGNDPAIGVGVILDYVTTSADKDEDLSPVADGSSMEGTPTTSIPITITNLSGSTGTVTVTLTYFRTE